MNPAPVFDRVYADIKKLLREGAMTPAFLEFNSFRVVYVDCYAQLKARHLTH
jgi:hypothetical protein